MPLRRHVVLGAAVDAALPARAQPVKIRLGTATPGGGFPVYGAAFVEAVRRADPALEIEAINTKGSTENVPMLEAGTLDIALVQGEGVHEARSGIGRRPANLKIITGVCEDHRGSVPHRVRVCGSRGFSLSRDRRSQGKADRLGRAGFGPGDPR